MIENDAFPKNIMDYLNSHPVFNQHKGIAEYEIFYMTNLGNLAAAQIYSDAAKIDYICSQYDITKEDCDKTLDIFRAAWSFDPKDENNLTMENATTFLRIVEIFYQEHYGKPSGFQFPQETVTIQDEEAFIV